MDRLKKIKEETAQILGEDLGFPLKIEFSSGVMFVNSAHQSQLDVLLKAAGQEVAVEVENLSSFAKLMHALGAFQAVVRGGKMAETYIDRLPFHRQLIGRRILVLSWLTYMRPEEIKFLPGGHSFGNNPAIEKTFLRNIIKFAECSGATGVVTFGFGVSAELRNAMIEHHDWAKGEMPILIDLVNPVDRRIANEHLGCDLSELPPEILRYSIDKNSTQRRSRSRKKKQPTIH
jgi:hypothetical protein